MSNVLQKHVKKKQQKQKQKTKQQKNPDIFASFATDHSPILFSLNQMSKFSHEKGLWKFNKSLLLK